MVRRRIPGRFSFATKASAVVVLLFSATGTVTAAVKTSLTEAAAAARRTTTATTAEATVAAKTTLDGSSTTTTSSAGTDENATTTTAATTATAPADTTYSTYRFDRDAADEDCLPGRQTVETCLNGGGDAFLKCPATCSKLLEPPFPMVQGRALNADAFYYNALGRGFFREYQTAGGEPVQFERFDGSITLVVALPMHKPAQARHFYELAEALVAEDPYRTACVAVPFYYEEKEEEDGSNNNTNNSTARATPIEPDVLIKGIHQYRTPKRRRCVVLEPYRPASNLESHPLVTYLEKGVTRQQRATQLVVYDDRATVWMVNHDAHYVERRITPTYDKMKRVLAHYYEMMDREL